MMSAKFDPIPPCPHLEMICNRKFMQPYYIRASAFPLPPSPPRCRHHIWKPLSEMPFTRSTSHSFGARCPFEQVKMGWLSIDFFRPERVYGCPPFQKVITGIFLATSHHYNTKIAQVSSANQVLVHESARKSAQTRFGPNRPAADMEGYGEVNFGVIYADFGEFFWRIFEEF